MGIRQHLNSKVVFVCLYVLAFVVYLIIGLQPAGAANHVISGHFSAQKIGLEADVTTLALDDRKLNTPDTIIGSYSRSDNKTLLIGHSVTVFKNLDQTKLGDVFEYNDKEYRVLAISMLPKTKVDMDALLQSAKKDTLIVMTCAGQLLDDGDATHRLILTAVNE